MRYLQGFHTWSFLSGYLHQLSKHYTYTIMHKKVIFLWNDCLRFFYNMLHLFERLVLFLPAHWNIRCMIIYRYYGWIHAAAIWSARSERRENDRSQSCSSFQDKCIFWSFVRVHHPRYPKKKPGRSVITMKSFHSLYVRRTCLPLIPIENTWHPG